MALANSFANKLVDCITGNKQAGASGKASYFVALGVTYNPVSGSFEELQSIYEAQSSTYAPYYARVGMTDSMYSAGASEQGLGQKIASNKELIQFPINLSEDNGSGDGDWPAVHYVAIYDAETGGNLIAAGALVDTSATQAGIVVHANEVALFKVKDLQVSIDLDPQASGTGLIGYKEGETPVRERTYTSSDLNGVNPQNVTTDDAKIASVYITTSGGNNTVHVCYGGNNAAQTTLLGKTNIHIFDTNNASTMHLVKTYAITAASMAAAHAISASATSAETAEVLDTISALENLNVTVEATNSNVAGAVWSSSTKQVKVYRGTTPGNTLIKVFNQSDSELSTRHIPYAVYKVNWAAS